MSVSSQKDSYHPQKGDVCYVPWRKEYWPVLVKNSYPKKMTYAFFPLPYDGKATTFTLVNPKKSLHLSITDETPLGKDISFVDALSAAKEYILNHGEEDGWKCNSYDPTNALTNGIKRTSLVVPTDDNEDEEELEHEEDNDDNSEVQDDTVDGEDEGPTEDSNEYKDENDPELCEPKPKKRRVMKTTRKRNGSTENEGWRFNKQPASFASGSSVKYDPSIPLNCIIFENVDDHLALIWASGKVRDYKMPERGEIALTLPYARILNENDADLLFEHCLNYVKKHEPECRALPAVSLVSSVIFPEIILLSVMKERNMTYDNAIQYMISLTGKPTECYKTEQSESPLHILVDAAIESKNCDK